MGWIRNFVPDLSFKSDQWPLILNKFLVSLAPRLLRIFTRPAPPKRPPIWSLSETRQRTPLSRLTLSQSRALSPFSDLMWSASAYHCVVIGFGRVQSRGVVDKRRIDGAFRSSKVVIFSISKDRRDDTGQVDRRPLTNRRKRCATSIWCLRDLRWVSEQSNKDVFSTVAIFPACVSKIIHSVSFHGFVERQFTMFLL